MLKHSLTKNQFTVFSIFSILLSITLSFLVFYQIQNPPSILLEQDKTQDTKILIFGDMMLDRHVREKINKNGAGYPFELIKNIIKNNDIVVTNAEGPFTSFESVTIGKRNGPLTFTFDPIILTTLKNLGFTLLGQANNHTLNFGFEGFNQSKNFITKAGLDYFGDPLNKNINPYIYKNKVGLIAYNEFSYQGKNEIISAIKELKKNVSYLIVYAHWGEEYNQNFTKSQQETAYKFIDAGADSIIGMHPHVIEPIEFYKDKPIFYSLGNFIFDQAITGPTTEGFALQIIINENNINYEIIPYFIKSAQVSLMDIENKQRVLNFLSENSTVSDPIKNKISEGKIIMNI